MVREREPRILVFDSGFGGLSVLSALTSKMPFAHYSFVADDARFPYGDLDDDALNRGLVAIIEEACEIETPDLLVVACNTASTVGLAALRARFSFPIAGIVPAIKPAASATQTGRFAVLATPGTIRRAYTHNLIRDFAGHCDVELVACQNLAQLAEAFLLHGERNEVAVAKEIAPAFVPVEGRDTDTIVLGCTHYPLLLPVLQTVAPGPFMWIDPAQAVARRAMHLLGQEWQDCLSGQKPVVSVENGRVAFYSTAGNERRLGKAWEALLAHSNS